MSDINNFKNLDEYPKESIEEVIALIDERPLERECFIRSVELLYPRRVIIGYSSAVDFLSGRSVTPAGKIILFNVGSRDISGASVKEEIASLLADPNHLPVVILASSDDLHQMVSAFEAGASGYIPASVGIDGIVDSASLAASGGVFLKIESLTKLYRSTVKPVVSTEPEPEPEPNYLTSRQTAVAEALRRGKANKMIAYELNMCESTVKVHVRNLMRKLEASNRTEAAYKLNTILPPQLASGPVDVARAIAYGLRNG